ncbi:small integral membrane protein 8 [Monomorium pharaonis]|uniref:small integral membrane protein 8 n=1 Tax=Monomorium pharaonis TaxID=307658 RepID=UPI00063F470A|nr:small integral membrane protein 8 [Monomorium pharaonis]
MCSDKEQAFSLTFRCFKINGKQEIRLIDNTMNKNTRETTPGDGLRSLRSTTLFRAVNFELYVKPNKIIMILGILTMLGCSGYIFYMNSNQNRNDYHTVIKSDSTVEMIKKPSKWTD